MRYTKETGYEAMISLETEKALQAQSAALSALGAETVDAQLFTGGGTLAVQIQPGDTLAAVLARSGALEEGQKIKAVHIGYPLGGIFGPSVLESPLTARILTDRGLCPGSAEIHILGENVCLVDYMEKLTKELQAETCGRCVFCREGLRQLHRIAGDITRGKATQDDGELIKLLADGMLQGGQCLFGKAAGAMWLAAMDEIGEEFQAHILRKRCAAMVCKKYITYHILGSKCKGCGACLDACPQEAIEGEEDYIHVIDPYECDKCGKCAEVCPHGAVVKAGAIKPKTPAEPIPVGSWRGR